MSSFDDREDRDTEKGEECPEQGYNDPSREEFLREHVCGAVQTILRISTSSICGSQEG